MWPIIPLTKTQIDAVFADVSAGQYAEALSHFLPPDYQTTDEDLKSLYPQISLIFRVQGLWGRLALLSVIYEEIVREWFLPTALAQRVHQAAIGANG